MRRMDKKLSLTVYGNFLLLSLIVLLGAFGASMRVYANEAVPQSISANAIQASVSTDASDTSSTASYTVIGIENCEQLSNLSTFEIVRGESQNTNPILYHILNNNLLKVNATIEDQNGTISPKTLSVLWSVTSSETTMTDTTVCGEYQETGIIQLPDATYQWGEDVLSVLTLPVKVYDPVEPIEIVELEEVWNEFSTAFSLEQNGSIEELLSRVAIQTTWPCYDASGNEYICPVIYNTENVRENTVGIYDITATFEAPLNCRFSDSLIVPSYSMPITVQASGHPRLDLSYISPNYEYILFPWITSGIDLDSMEVWLSENDGEWRMLELNKEAYIHSTMLDIYAWYLTEGSSYRIQVKYEGGQTGIASFTYEWDKLSDKEYIEGDRDGGDTDGNPPDNSPEDENTDSIQPDEPSEDENTDSIQPDEPSKDNDTDHGDSSVTDDTVSMPEEDETGTVEKDTPNEDINSEIKKADTSIQVSDYETEKETEVPSADREKPYLLGREITLMVESLGTARFSAGTIMLDIPDDAIDSLNIGDTDRLLVTVLPLENHGFTIDIFKNDIAVTALPSMQISLPYQPPANTVPVLMSEDGSEKITAGDYEQDTGLVTFTIQETGTFYIKDEEVPLQNTPEGNTLTVSESSISEQDNDDSALKPIAIVATAITCPAGAATFIYMKKRRM